MLFVSSYKGFWEARELTRLKYWKTTELILVTVASYLLNNRTQLYMTVIRSHLKTELRVTKKW